MIVLFFNFIYLSTSTKTSLITSSPTNYVIHIIAIVIVNFCWSCSSVFTLYEITGGMLLVYTLIQSMFMTGLSNGRGPGERRWVGAVENVVIHVDIIA